MDLSRSSYPTPRAERTRTKGSRGLFASRPRLRSPCSSVPWPPCSTPSACLRESFEKRASTRARSQARDAGSGGDRGGAKKEAAARDAASAAARDAEHAALLALARESQARERLPAFVQENRERLTTAFLCFVTDLARGAPRRSRGPGGSGGGGSGGGGGTPIIKPPLSADERAELSALAAELTSLKEAADFSESSRLLPPMAASLAYSNYERWRRDNPGSGGFEEVAPGVTLEDVYRAGERMEARLHREGASALRPQQQGGGGSSGGVLDDFTARGRPGAAYADFASAAMARVRARLSGYVDDRGGDFDDNGAAGDVGGGGGGGGGGTTEDGDHRRQAWAKSSSSRAGAEAAADSGGDAAAGGLAARRVLRELLHACVCREERAEAIAIACVPPGLPITATAAVNESSGGPGGVGGVGGGGGSACTTPDGLLAAIAVEQKRIASDKGSNGSGGGGRGGGGNGGAGAGAEAEAEAAVAQSAVLLPSGEPIARVLEELEEDVAAYGSAVYSRLTPLERFGA